MKDRDEAAAWALNDADACRMLLFKWQSIEANGGRQASAAMAEWLSDVIRAARQAGAEEERERCCEAVCQWCSLGDFEGHTNKVLQSEGVWPPQWHHKVEPPLDDSELAYFRCDASAIRVRALPLDSGVTGKR